MAVNVAELCERLELTVAELARRAELDESRTLAIMMGRWTPSPSERQRVAAALGVAVDEIRWGHQTPIQHLYGHGPG
ncbi:MAG: helix-turn-helix domain-containing protein [Pirellulales bacterium]